MNNSGEFTIKTDTNQVSYNFVDIPKNVKSKEDLNNIENANAKRFIKNQKRLKNWTGRK